LQGVFSRLEELVMNIVVSGSVAYDYLMTFPGEFKENILPDQLENISLSFLVDSLVRRRGGVAPNIAYTMAILGRSPKVFSTVGIDFEEYRSWLEGKGVDTTYAKVIEGVHTASFFATTDKENAQIASFFPGAMGHAAEISIKDVEGKVDLVLVSANQPDGMEKYIRECKEMDIPFVYDLSQQIAFMDGESLARGIDGALTLFANEYEYSLIQKKTGLSEEDILGKVEFMVITLGEKGAAIYENGTKTIVDAFIPTKIVDPTGAGDAFRGGFFTGYSKGWDLKTCVQIGTLTAVYCLESDGPQGHNYTIEEFIIRYRKKYDDGGLLDELKK
jgi:adenosine kinase